MDNTNEILRVLKLVEEGKITAEDGAGLINALSVKTAEEETVKEESFFNTKFADKFGSKFAEKINRAVSRAVSGIEEFEREGKFVFFDSDEEKCACGEDNGDTTDGCSRGRRVHFNVDGSKGRRVNINIGGSEDKNNVIATSKGTITKGNYGSVKVLGMLNIEEGVTIDTLSINGSCKAADGLAADNVSVNGKLSLEGSATFDNCRVHGSLDCGGTLKCDNISINGSGTFADVECDSFFAGGSVNCNNLTADSVKLKGIFDIANIKTDELHANADRDFNAKDRRKIGTIECDSIKAEFLDCDKLICEEAVLGRECNIREIVCETIVAEELNCDILKCEEHKLGSKCKIGKLNVDVENNE